MSTILIRKHLDSDTLYLPELRELIGKNVEITVKDVTAVPTGEFWNPPTLDELAERQSYRGPLSRDTASGSLAEADWEGFDEWLEEQRRPPAVLTRRQPDTA